MHTIQAQKSFYDQTGRFIINPTISITCTLKYTLSGVNSTLVISFMKEFIEGVLLYFPSFEVVIRCNLIVTHHLQPNRSASDSSFYFIIVCYVIFLSLIMLLR